MTHGTWFNAFSDDEATGGLPAQAREELVRIDKALFAIWNLGDNVLLGWTSEGRELLVLAVRHYAIPETIHAAAGSGGGMSDPPSYINKVLAGPKRLEAVQFERVRRTLGCTPQSVPVRINLADERLAALVSDMVRRYGVSLVRNRAVILLDAVKFSLQSPLHQMAMLNSLAFSVNSAYGQLLSKGIRIDFARTTTGDGFYIWNRSTTPDANAELYKLMMLVLADNAVAQRKARGSWVPRLRTAFHVGEHYEFQQIQGVNPTRFSYIVGQVTVDLARLVDQALPGQILLGDFAAPLAGEPGGLLLPWDTRDFVENTAATLSQLNGLTISGGRIRGIRCYLTGPAEGGHGYGVSRYALRDKHGASRSAYNAKINIYREFAEPIFLGLPYDNLASFGSGGTPSMPGDEVGQPRAGAVPGDRGAQPGRRSMPGPR